MASIFREAIRLGDPALPILSISIHDGITDDEVAPEDRDRRVSQIEDRTKYKRVQLRDHPGQNALCETCSKSGEWREAIEALGIADSNQEHY